MNFSSKVIYYEVSYNALIGECMKVGSTKPREKSE